MYEMRYCLDCKVWTNEEPPHDHCPECHGNRLIDPIAERNEWMDRIEKMTIIMDDVLESLKTILPTTMFPVRKFIQILIDRIEGT